MIGLGSDKNELVHMFNHPSGSAAIEFCRTRQELENGAHKHMLFFDESLNKQYPAASFVDC